MKLPHSNQTEFDQWRARRYTTAPIQQPPVAPDPIETITLRLPRSVCDYLRDVGNGDASAGATRTIQACM